MEVKYPKFTNDLPINVFIKNKDFNYPGALFCIAMIGLVVAFITYFILYLLKK